MLQAALLSLFGVFATVLDGHAEPRQEPDRVTPDASTERTAEVEFELLLQRLAAARTLTFDAVHGLGPGKDKLITRTLLQRAEPVPKFRVTVGEAASAYDGSTFCKWSPSEQRLLRGDGDRAFLFRELSLRIEPLLVDGGDLLLRPFKDGERRVSFGVTADLDRSGKPTRELLIEWTKGAKSLRWSIRIDEAGLPRTWAELNAEGIAQRSVEYFNLRLDPELPEQAFSIPTPRGIEPESFDEVIAELMRQSQGQAPPTQLMPVGTKVADFELQAADGTVRRLSDLRGRVVLLDFWASWCAPCKMAMPDVQRLHQDYAARGVTVFGVNVFETDEAAARAYWQEKRFGYELLMGGGPLAAEYGFRGIPTFVVLDQEGRVAFAATGAGNDRWVRATLERLLPPAPGTVTDGSTK